MLLIRIFALAACGDSVRHHAFHWRHALHAAFRRFSVFGAQGRWESCFSLRLFAVHRADEKKTRLKMRVSPSGKPSHFPLESRNCYYCR